MKTYRSNHFPIKIVCFFVFVLFILFSGYIFLINTTIYDNVTIQIVWCILFFYSIFYVGFPELNSALFFKLIVSTDTITVIDYMPQWFIHFPDKQIIVIENIESIFRAPYDLASSIKTSRFRFNKNTKSYDYKVTKNPNILKYTVLKIKNSKNAYIRYFWCLSINSRKEIIDHLQSVNKNIINRL